MKRYILLMLFLLSQVGLADITPSTNIVINHTQYDHVVWSGIPVSFTLPVGKERIIKFSSPVELTNTNPELTSDKISIQNNNGFLYITAKKSFPPVRVPIVIKKTGTVVLVDISANKNNSDTPVSVVTPSDIQANNKQSDQNKPQFINYVTLMRYAIQNLYSPERLVATNQYFSRTPMYTTHSVNLFNNQNVMAMPMISWAAGNLYVTAVLLKNTWDQKIILDPRSLNGNWLAVSFYPSNFVLSKGTSRDRTTIFLISDQPFNNALTSMRGYV